MLIDSWSHLSIRKQALTLTVLSIYSSSSQSKSSSTFNRSCFRILREPLVILQLALKLGQFGLITCSLMLLCSGPYQMVSGLGLTKWLVASLCPQFDIGYLSHQWISKCQYMKIIKLARVPVVCYTQKC